MQGAQDRAEPPARIAEAREYQVVKEREKRAANRVNNIAQEYRPSPIASDKGAEQERQAQTRIAEALTAL